MNDRKRDVKSAMLGRRVLGTALGVVAVAVVAISAVAGVTMETLAIGTPKNKDNRVNVGVYVVNSDGTGQQNKAALVQSEIKYDQAYFKFEPSSVKAAGADGKLAPYSDSSIIKYNNDETKGVIKLSYCDANVNSAIKIDSNDACVFSFALVLLKENPAGTCTLTSENQKYWNFNGASKPERVSSKDDEKHATAYARKGDVDASGLPDITDVVKIVDYLGEILELTQRQKQIADVDMNGITDIEDVVAIVDYLGEIRDLN